MTAHLFAEAIDTLFIICRALLAWLVVGAVVATAGLLGGIAAAVWPWVTAWGRVTGALAAGAALRSLQTGACGAGRGLASSGCLDTAPEASDASTGTRDAVDAPSRSHSRCCGIPQGSGGGFHAPGRPDGSQRRPRLRTLSAHNQPLTKEN